MQEGEHRHGLVAIVRWVTFFRRVPVNTSGIGGCGRMNPPADGGWGVGTVGRWMAVRHQVEGGGFRDVGETWSRVMGPRDDGEICSEEERKDTYEVGWGHRSKTM